MSSNIAARASLRDCVRRLKRMLETAGVTNAGDVSRIHGDMPFPDAVGLFTEDAAAIEAKLKERTARNDGQAVMLNHEIDKMIRGLGAQLDTIKNMAEATDKLRIKLEKKKNPENENRIRLLRVEYDKRRETVENCEKALDALKDSFSRPPGSKGSAADREELKGQRRGRRGRKGAATRYANVDDAINGDDVGGSADLRKDDETKQQMATIDKNDKVIDSLLTQIGSAVNQLKETAQAQSDVLDQQQHMLDNLEVKMDKTTNKLSNINGRLSKLVRGHGKMNIFMNIVCGVLILAVVGYILYDMGVIPV